jgi:hypothetical protein
MSMTFIQRFELTGTQASIEFTSIPATFTDLFCFFSFRMATTNTDIEIDFNSDTNKTNYTSKRLGGAGSGSGFSDSIKYYYISNSSGYTANTFGNGGLYIPNYRAAVNKSFSIDFVQETNATEAFSLLGAGLWSNTAAINTLTFRGQAGQNFGIYSSATLYGITAGSDGTTVVS